MRHEDRCPECRSFVRADAETYHEELEFEICDDELVRRVNRWVEIDCTVCGRVEVAA